MSFINSRYLQAFFSLSFYQVNIHEMYALLRPFGQIHDIQPKRSQKFKVKIISPINNRFNCRSFYTGTIIDEKEFSYRSFGSRKLYESDDVESEDGDSDDDEPNENGPIENEPNEDEPNEPESEDNDTDEDETDEDEPNESKFQIPNELKLAPAQDAPQNIINALNNDCLQHIFDELDMYDLYNVAHTCKHFNTIAKQSFKSRYSQKHRSLIQDLFDEKLASLFQVELFLRSFGTELRSLDLNFESHPNKEIVLRMCIEHCTKITALSMYGCCWPPGLESDVRRLLPRLKKLEIRFTCVDRCPVEDFFIGDLPLEAVHLYANIDWPALTIKLPKLHRLALHGDFVLSEQLIQQCALESPQIHEIEFIPRSISASGLSRLPTYLPSCHKLKLICGADVDATASFVEWQHFNSLKSLELALNCVAIEKILTSLAMGEVPLRVLALCSRPWSTDDDLFKLMTPFQHVEQIKFHNLMTSDTAIDIHRLAQSLKVLSEVTFSSCDRLTTNRIQSFLRRIVKPLRLSVRIKPYIHPLKMPEEDCKEINELVKARPEMKFTVEIPEANLKVSGIFHIVTIVWCIFSYF